MTEDWTVRPGQRSDQAWIATTLGEDLARNSYFYGVGAQPVANLAARAAQSDGWATAVVCTSDEDHEPAGWVMYRSVPTLVVAYAHVEPAFRGLGAWRALRAHLGLRDGQLVGIVLGSPSAMSAARKRYQARHNWGTVLEWLS